MTRAGGTWLRNELEGALRAEIDELEVTITRTWQVLAGACIAGGIVVWQAMKLPLGLWCAVGSLAYFAWFTVEMQLRRRGSRVAWLSLANVIVESSMPWVFLLVLVYSQGAAYALSSWLPPMLFAAIILASTARLRPLAPLVVGISGALVFFVAYLALVRGMLPPATIDQPIYQPMMQLTRALSLVLAGVLAMLVARGLRRAFGRAEGTVRQDELFGKYRIERQIGSGGMGTVHEARYCPDGGFERRVAIKRIHPHLARLDSFIDAFRREAELCSMLAHPNIVQVFDFGRAQGSFFLAMEFVEGFTLAGLMQRYYHAGITFTPPVVAHIARELLAGLSYSHGGARDGQGAVLRVVHRDLCPQNVLVSKNGEVKITDFGVARALRDVAAMDTRTVVGHCSYMAPEQAKAEALDERCDIFSLGVVLWELLCGRPLFDRGSDAATMMALVSDPVLPPSSVVECDLAWDDFIMRALERDPAQRYPSASAMAEALDAIPDARTPVASDAIVALIDRAQSLPPSSQGVRMPSSQSDLPTRQLERAVS